MDKLAARLHLLLVIFPLRPWWRQHWLVLLVQAVHLQVHLALAAAFLGAAPRLVGRGRWRAHKDGVWGTRSQSGAWGTLRLSHVKTDR